MASLKKNINLLPKNELEKSPWGKFLQWALTFGRYTVIFTELTVVIGFLLRFKLDLNLAKINSQIKKNQEIVVSFQALENKVNQLKTKLDFIKKNQKDNLFPYEILKEIALITPQDIVFSQINLEKGAFSLQGKSLSKNSLVAFINQLRTNNKFSQINLESVSSKGKKGPVIKFSLSAKINHKQNAF